MHKIILSFSSLWRTLLLNLPEEFSKCRVWYYNRKGCNINRRAFISQNVRIRGKCEMDEGSSIDQNTCIYGDNYGVFIGKNVTIASNVHILGKIEIGEGSSIAQNSSISGESTGVFIGKNVMIAPNVVIVAFNHGYDDLDIPMRVQKKSESPIYIEDDVWIAANTTIVKGVTVGKGSIIGSNSFVNKSIPPYSIVAGVPAKLIRSRIA